MQKKCIVCGEVFTKKSSCSKRTWAKAKYCSTKCSGIAWTGHKAPNSAFKKGHNAWNKGNHIKLNDALSIWHDSGGGIGGRNHKWRGDKVGYSGVHMWVRLHKEKPSYCTKCGKEGNSHQIHWSNIDHKYKRNLDDYVALCASCHKRYDLDNGLVKHQLRE